MTTSAAVGKAARQRGLTWRDVLLLERRSPAIE
jgi:hypothetical protein